MEIVKWRSSNNKNAIPAEVPINTLSRKDNQNREISQEKLGILMPSPIYYNNISKNRESTYANSEQSSSVLQNNISSASNNERESTNTINQTTAVSNNESNIYLNTSTASNQNHERNGATRKVPENLKLQNSPLLETLTLSVQSSPSLSTCSGPYIPISECFSGTPKHLENPITPLNNLDPKFYDTPRSHNNIGLNLTNDQSYSPKITNYNAKHVPAPTNCATVNRSDSDSESVFTDDDDWTYPMPLRENVDRNTRPSDSSVENESFVLTYSQRFSKLPDDVNDKSNVFTYDVDAEKKNQPIEMSKKYKNKQNLSLDIKKNERTLKEILQLSDTENTSPAMGPLDANSIVDESYDIPRSHQLPYHNIDQIFNEKIWTPKTEESSNYALATTEHPKSNTQKKLQEHFYTNAAPNKLEGNVFRYDFIQHTELPPVNRKLKPKLSINNKLPEGESESQCVPEKPVKKGFIESSTPPSVDRNLKPNVYKTVNSSLLEHGMRRSVDISSSIEVMPEIDECILETRTLPRKISSFLDRSNNGGTADISVLHQRSKSAANSMYQESVECNPLQKNTKNEHRLQYFDLDVTNPPTINRQSISTSNLTKEESSNVDLLPKSSLKSGVVYNSVDFVKTEAFKRIREERKKESEGVSSK
ncbi:protein daughter of sevenless isoform X3 [Bactrocera dorsalis]|uniref:Protein daughter of sevenless isoform X3 n=1 Tax=Bactrocera dorsalis TaxID=27457 RepID=A0ABM3JYU9_BACDO|nr:protein daughter of sevenless isoform X3 [Bactrocera dorsalis]